MKSTTRIFIWLVVGPPLWKIWTSIGMIRNPIYGKIKNVPNHQPVMIVGYVYAPIAQWFSLIIKVIMGSSLSFWGSLKYLAKPSTDQRSETPEKLEMPRRFKKDLPKEWFSGKNRHRDERGGVSWGTWNLAINGECPSHVGCSFRPLRLSPQRSPARCWPSWS